MNLDTVMKKQKISQNLNIMNNVKKIRVTLYCEYYRFMNGVFFKGAEMGFLTSFKNQMKILTREGVQWTEDLSQPCDVFQANAQGLRTMWLIQKYKHRGIPTIIYAHATAEEWTNAFRGLHYVAFIYKWFLIKLYNSADKVICVSEYNKQIIHERYNVPFEKLVFISNGVDAARFEFNELKRKEFRHELKIEDNELFIINVAIVLFKKGIGTFIELAKNFPQIKFYWFGKIFTRAAEKIPLYPKNISFFGFAPDIVAAYSAGDIFIFPSYEENQGISVLEAGARGLPILVRDIPVYYSWLQDGINCLKAKTNEEFIYKLSLLLTDSNLRNKLGATAKEMVFRDHSLESVGKKLMNLYGTLIRT